MRAAFRALLQSITQGERKLILAVALAVMVVTAVPPVYGWIQAERSGTAWIGRQFLSESDLTVYLSSIAQAKAGAALTGDLFTTEPVTPTFNLAWYAVGRLAALFSLTPIAAFHVARLLLIPALVFISYLAVAWFLADRRQRIATFLLFMFGSGLGGFAAPFLPQVPPHDGTYLWPIDFWVGESNAFMTMVYSPHFVASLALWLFAALALAVAYEKRNVLGAAIAGLAACALFQFHPYHVPVLYAIAAAWCGLLGARHGWRKAPWLECAAFIGVSAPAVAYQYLSIHADAFSVAHAMTNYTLTPPLPYVLVGFGAISVLWIFGARSASRSGAIPRDRLAMLVVWVMVQGLLLYAPFRFQRRFLEGLQFPMTVLAVPALFDLYARLKSARRFGKEMKLMAGVMAVAAVFLVSTALAATRNVELYADTSDRMMFASGAEARAWRWLAAETPADAVVLSSPFTGNVIPASTGRRVYIGHWSETIDVMRKALETARFYRDMDDVARAAFMRERGITHVFLGPEERKPSYRPFGPAFERAYADGGVEIYVLRPAKP